MSTSLLTGGTPRDPLAWRRTFLERKYREVYLPEMYDPFEVDGVPLSPAEALEKCRPEQYQIALTEYARREGDTALEMACDSFPFPVAKHLDQGLNAPTELQRLLHFRDTAEALILVLLALLVSECRAKGVKLAEVKYPNPNDGKPLNLTEAKLLNGSVAHRLTMLEGILRSLKGHPSLACVQRLPLEAVRRLTEFKEIRNDFSHSEAMTEHEAGLVCQELREQLADAMIAFEWLAETELAVFDNVVRGKPNTVRFELHCGQGMARRERVLTATAWAKCQSLGVSELDRPMFHFAGEVFEATPFLHTELHPKGHRRHIWILKRHFPNTAQFEFEIVGEREPPRVVSDSPAAVELRVLDKLFT